MSELPPPRYDVDPPGEPESDASLYFRLIGRTTLLALSIVLLFPTLLDWPTHGAWPLWIQSLGSGRWLAWGACFVAMSLMRFAGGPKRR